MITMCIVTSWNNGQMVYTPTGTGESITDITDQPAQTVIDTPSPNSVTSIVKVLPETAEQIRNDNSIWVVWDNGQ